MCANIFADSELCVKYEDLAPELIGDQSEMGVQQFVHTFFTEMSQYLGCPLNQYVVFAHWMLCCPVGYVERGGPYLPWQGKQFRELSAAWLPIGEAFTGCTPIGQAVIHLR